MHFALFNVYPNLHVLQKRSTPYEKQEVQPVNRPLQGAQVYAYLYSV